MEKESWIDELKPEMVGEYEGIAKAIGVHNLIKLAEYAGGASIYIPKADTLIRPIRDKKIKEEFNGYNHLQLAKKYNLSVRWIREICGEGGLEGQMDIEDFLK